jgi:hypothetical protein
MDIATVALVVAALGVNFGWQPSAEDPQAYEVLMQVEPELVDEMADGRQIPLESHVPASVAPIRNIRVVVGTEELPRQAIAKKSDAKGSTERVVRGQEESPLSHTANFQSDDGWSGDRYPPATGSTRQYDQRGASIGVEPIRTAQNDPWTIDNAKQTATEAGNSLRDSFNSGIQQTNQQISDGTQKMLNSAQQSGSEFGQQLQDMTGFGSTSSAPPAAAATSRSSQSSWPAPPPLASPQSSAPAMSGATAATAPGWSSIKAELAPPRLPTPSIPNVTRMASNAPSSRSAGPSFPPPPATNSQPLHSVLADPSASSSNSANQDWASVWGTSSMPSSSAHGSDVGVGMVPVTPRVSNAFPAPPTQTATVDPDAARWAWPSPTSTGTAITANSNPAGAVADDRYKTSSIGSANGADAWADFPSQQNNSANSGPTDRVAAQSPSHVIPASSPQNQPIAGNQPVIGVQPSANPQQQGPRPEEVPWKPLLAVSLALAGSLGANLFLGWSYADARHRYLALVAKTTHTFQKAAGLAA